jgi:hypothetical protein
MKLKPRLPRANTTTKLGKKARTHVRAGAGIWRACGSVARNPEAGASGACTCSPVSGHASKAKRRVCLYPGQTFIPPDKVVLYYSNGDHDRSILAVSLVASYLLAFLLRRVKKSIEYDQLLVHLFLFRSPAIYSFPALV